MIPLLTLFTIDADFIGSTTAYIADMITDAKLLLILVIGLPLAFWVVRRIVGLVRLRG